MPSQALTLRLTTAPSATQQIVAEPDPSDPGEQIVTCWRCSRQLLRKYLAPDPMMLGADTFGVCPRCHRDRFMVLVHYRKMLLAERDEE